MAPILKFIEEDSIVHGVFLWIGIAVAAFFCICKIRREWLDLMPKKKNVLNEIDQIVKAPLSTKDKELLLAGAEKDLMHSKLGIKASIPDLELLAKTFIEPRESKYVWKDVEQFFYHMKLENGKVAIEISFFERLLGKVSLWIFRLLGVMFVISSSSLVILLFLQQYGGVRTHAVLMIVELVAGIMYMKSTYEYEKLTKMQKWLEERH